MLPFVGEQKQYSFALPDAAVISTTGFREGMIIKSMIRYRKISAKLDRNRIIFGKLGKFCKRCMVRLKKQKLGSNQVYYCPRCGRFISSKYL